jgi:dTDP-4-dehydrorhamnose reductase
MKTALVTGANGGLGREFCTLLKADGYEVIEITRKEFDLAQVGIAEKIFARYSDVDVLINNNLVAKLPLSVFWKLTCLRVSLG